MDGADTQITQADDDFTQEVKFFGYSGSPDELDHTGRAEHPATDYGIDDICSFLTGKDLLLTVETTHGVVHVDRLLLNVSAKPTSKGVVLVGWDPEKQACRSYRLALIRELKVVGVA